MDRGFAYRSAKLACGMREERRDELLALSFESLPPERVMALVSTRGGGVSVGAYASLNMGLRVGDEEAAVLTNRRRFFDAFGLPLERSMWCRQVHADAVVVVDEQTACRRADGRCDRGALDETTVIADTDALITDLVGVPLCVTLADCVPVVLYDPDHHVVGLAHAGWGGTVARIASRTVALMRSRFQTDPRRLLAGIGPSIDATNYEVGSDVIARAGGAYGPDAARIMKPASVPGKAHFDLWVANRIDLCDAGVPPDQIELSGVSTVQELDRFYSHRHQTRGPHPQTGRFIAVAMLVG